MERDHTQYRTKMGSHTTEQSIDPKIHPPTPPSSSPASQTSLASSLTWSMTTNSLIASDASTRGSAIEAGAGGGTSRVEGSESSSSARVDEECGGRKD